MAAQGRIGGGLGLGQRPRRASYGGKSRLGGALVEVGGARGFSAVLPSPRSGGRRRQETGQVEQAVGRAEEGGGRGAGLRGW